MHYNYALIFPSLICSIKEVSLCLKFIFLGLAYIFNNKLFNSKAKKMPNYLCLFLTFSSLS